MSEYRWQTALRLREEGYSYEEISVAMGIAENTVSAMLRRARHAEPEEVIARLEAENARLRERIRILELTDE